MTVGDSQLELFDLGTDVEPLQGMDEIDWAGVADAYGPATDVPHQIRGLLAKDRGRREKAASDLYNSVCHEGTRYPAAALVVPFLLRLAALRAYPDRGGVVELLAAFAIGYDENWIPNGFPIAQIRAHTSVDSDETGLGKAALAAYDAVRTGIPLLLSLLAERDLAVRCQACYSLAWFPEHADQVVPTLLNRAIRESDAAIAATALVSAGLAATPDFGELVISHADQLRARSRLLGWAAAIASARLARSSAPEWVPAELCAWVGGNTTVAEHGVPFLRGDLRGYAAASLLQGGEGWLDQATTAMLRRLRAVSGKESLNLLSSLLAATFRTGKLVAGVSFDDLTERQKRVVRALGNAPKAWLSMAISKSPVLAN